MEHSEYYEADVLAYFSGKPEELALYEAVYAQLCRAFPDASVKVQKSQISFYNRHLFAAVSLPVRRKKDWPKTCILVTSASWTIPGSPWRWSPILIAGPIMWCSPTPPRRTVS